MSIKSLFEDIADAIREKSGSSDTYTPAEMPEAITNLPSGGGSFLASVTCFKCGNDTYPLFTANENGTYSFCCIAINGEAGTRQLDMAGYLNNTAIGNILNSLHSYISSGENIRNYRIQKYNNVTMQKGDVFKIAISNTSSYTVLLCYAMTNNDFDALGGAYSKADASVSASGTFDGLVLYGGVQGSTGKGVAQYDIFEDETTTINAPSIATSFGTSFIFLLMKAGSIDLLYAIDNLNATSNDYTDPYGYRFIISASSTYQSSANRQAYNAFNTNYVSGDVAWHPASGVPQWLQIEFPEAVKVKQFRLKNRSGNVEHPTAFTLQGSNNGTTWDDIQAYTWTATGSNLTLDCTVTDPGLYKYYRLYINGVTNSPYGVIAQWRFLEVEQ